PCVPARIFRREMVRQPPTDIGTEATHDADHQGEIARDLTDRHAMRADEDGRTPHHTAIPDQGSYRHADHNMPRGGRVPEVMEPLLDDLEAGAKVERRVVLFRRHPVRTATGRLDKRETHNE